MSLSGLKLARDGIGYGGLSVAKDGFTSSVKTSTLTICPPGLTNYSLAAVLDSIQLGIEYLSSDEISLTVEYLEYLLAIDSISYDLIMSSTICPPSLVSYSGLVGLESILIEPELSSGEFTFLVDSVEYLIEVDSIDLKPSGLFEKCHK